MRGRQRGERTARRLMNQLEQFGLTRGVMTAFLCIAIIFGIAIILAYHSLAPESALHPIVAMLGVPPALLIIVIGALTSTLSQALIDAFFIPVAIGYWLLIAFAVDRIYGILYKLLGKLGLALSHQKMKFVK